MASTIRDVANLAGLSLGTVSKYINGTPVKEINRIKIENAIKELNFRPNNIAKGLRNAQSFSVAVLVPMLTSNFCTSMISSIEAYLLPKGYSVIVCECHNDAEMELQKTRFLLDRMIDGIVLIPFSSSGKQIELIQESNTPLIVVDQLIDGYPADSIILDNYRAGYEPVQKLIELNHKKIAVIIGNSDHYTSRRRLDGYLSAMRKYHVPVIDSYIQSGGYSMDGGYDAMLRLAKLNDLPTAVFISNYDMTIGAFLAVNYLGLRIPDDISIIGFDNFPLANVVNPPLSFAAQPTDEMGLAAAKLLYKRMLGDWSDYPNIVEHEPEFYYKESVRSLN